jgi:hypothetical protein
MSVSNRGNVQWEILKMAHIVDGVVQQYATKVDRIKTLEAALLEIEEGKHTLAGCIKLAKSLRRTDKRWVKDTERSWAKVNEAQKAGC